MNSKTLAALLAASTLLVSPGCATKNLTPESKLNLVKIISAEAAYVGASYDLLAAPSNRGRYVVVTAALEALIKSQDYDPEKLRAALADLPLLAGSQGALLVELGVVVYSVSAGFIDVDSAPYVKAALIGIHGGLTRALARPTGPATSALAPELPAQITVPTRHLAAR